MLGRPAAGGPALALVRYCVFVVDCFAARGAAHTAPRTYGGGKLQKYSDDAMPLGQTETTLLTATGAKARGSEDWWPRLMLGLVLNLWRAELSKVY